MTEVITSPANRYVRLARLLGERRHRDRLGMFRLEGFRAIETAVQAGAEIEAIIFTETRPDWSPPGCLCRQVTPQVFRAISGTQTPQGIMALGRQQSVSLEKALEGEPPFVLIVDGVQDPGNLGTILRTAAAAGVTAAVLTEGTVDVYNDKVLRASAGELFRLPVARDVRAAAAAAAIHAQGLQAVAAVAAASTPYFRYDWQGPLAVVIGSEATGLRSVWHAVWVGIPMYRPVESLNVAVASGILLFEAARQRLAARD